MTASRRNGDPDDADDADDADDPDDPEELGESEEEEDWLLHAVRTVPAIAIDATEQAAALRVRFFGLTLTPLSAHRLPRGVKRAHKRRELMINIRLIIRNVKVGDAFFTVGCGKPYLPGRASATPTRGSASRRRHPGRQLSRGASAAAPK
jgi:hypothetical protein